MSKKISLFIMATTMVVNAIVAQDESIQNDLDSVVIAATKTPKKISETGQQIHIISREAIAQAGSKDLAQVLSEQSGLIINGANSNFSKNKSIFLEGAGSGYTQLLLDGIPINISDIRLLPLAQIERIEILKGSQSTLYGSNAIAGVINIITKQARSKQIHFDGGLVYGTYNSTKIRADVNQKVKWFDYDLNYQRFQTDGIAEARDSIGGQNFPKNGATQNAYQANFGISLSQKLKINPYIRYSKLASTFSADAFQGGNNQSNTSFLNMGLTAKYLHKKGSMYALYGYNDNKLSSTTAYGTYDTRAFLQHAEVFGSYTFNQNLEVVAGVAYENTKTQGVDTSMNTIAPYASVYYKLPAGIHFDVGMRFNHSSQYGNTITYSINPYFEHKFFKFFANLSSGYKAPTIAQLYGGYGSNPVLKPEISTSFNWGIELGVIKNKIKISASNFYRKITNNITYNNALALLLNYNKVQTQGVALGLQYDVTTDLKIQGNYTFVVGTTTQQVASATKDTTFSNLFYIPTSAVNLLASYQFTAHWFANTSVQYIGARYGLDYNTPPYPNSVEMSSYALWNVYVSYRFFKNKCNLFVDAKNITDNTSYSEVYGYNVQGRTVSVGMNLLL